MLIQKELIFSNFGLYISSQLLVFISLIMFVFQAASVSAQQRPSVLLYYVNSLQPPSAESGLARASGKLQVALELARKQISGLSIDDTNDLDQKLHSMLWLAETLLQDGQSAKASEESLKIMRLVFNERRKYMRIYVKALNIYAESSHTLGFERDALDQVEQTIYSLAPISEIEWTELAPIDLQAFVSDLRNLSLTNLGLERFKTLRELSNLDHSLQIYSMPEITLRRFERLYEAAMFASSSRDPDTAAVGSFWLQRIPKILLGAANYTFKGVKRGNKDHYQAYVVLSRIIHSLKKIKQPLSTIAAEQKFLGGLLIEKGHNLMAVEVLRLSLNNMLKSRSSTSASIWDARNTLAIALGNTGNFPEALMHHYKNIDLLESDDLIFSEMNIRTILNLIQILNNDRLHDLALKLAGSGLILLDSLEEKKMLDGDQIRSIRLSFQNQRYIALSSIGRFEESFEVIENIYELTAHNRASREPDSLVLAQNYASSLVTLRRNEEAIKVFEEIRPLSESIFGTDHENFRRLLNGNASALRNIGRNEDALKLANRSLEIALQRAGTLAVMAPKERDFQRLMLIQIAGFVASLSAEMSANAESENDRRIHFEWALMAAQLSSTSPLTEGIRNALLKRIDFASIREDLVLLEKLNLSRTIMDTQLLFSSAEASDQNLSRLKLSKEIQDLSSRIRGQNPNFAAYLAPQEVTLSDIQQKLRDNEALVILSELGNYTLAITREEYAVSPIDLLKIDESGYFDPQSGTQRNFDKIRSLRASLEGTENSGPGHTRFDRKTSNEIFSGLFGGARVENLIGKKARWIIVPHGEFLSVPFNALVTQMPSGDDDDPKALRRTKWMAFEIDFKVVPSIYSFTSSKLEVRDRHSEFDYIAFGDPDFEQPSYTGSKGKSSPEDLKDKSESVWRYLKYEKRLSASRREITGVQRHFENGRSQVFLGADANEENLISALNSGALEGTRIIHFATHGKTSGSLPGLLEPSLILSRAKNGPFSLTGPNNAEFVNDGILTTSEIVQFDFDADWVILSACDSGHGLESHSSDIASLTSSFFQAGARSMLVSHWKVWDEVGAVLISNSVGSHTIDAWDGIKSLKDTMRNVMEGKSDLEDKLANGITTAHPAIWAVMQVFSSG